MSHYVEQKKVSKTRLQITTSIVLTWESIANLFFEPVFFFFSNKTPNIHIYIFTDKYKTSQIRYAWHLPLYLYFPTA